MIYGFQKFYPFHFVGIIVDKKPGKPSLLDESLRSDDSEIKNLHPQVQVFFVDSGDKIWVNLNEVRMLPKWCMQVPKLAIKVKNLSQYDEYLLKQDFTNLS